LTLASAEEIEKPSAKVVASPDNKDRCDHLSRTMQRLDQTVGRPDIAMGELVAVMPCELVGLLERMRAVLTLHTDGLPRSSVIPRKNQPRPSRDAY
jgi:hypothetical protein